MDTVLVNRSELLEKIRANRDTHRSTFEQAQKIYRQEVIKELDVMLTDASNNRNIKRYISLPEPEDHTSDYDTVIQMLEMSVDDNVEITHHEFQQYVQDKWGWSHSFAANTMSYTTRA